MQGFISIDNFVLPAPSEVTSISVNRGILHLEKLLQTSCSVSIVSPGASSRGSWSGENAVFVPSY